MRVFVTGGTGFIGLPVIRNLINAGHDVLLLVFEPKETMVSRSEIFNKVKLIHGNLIDISEWREDLEQFKPDVTVHMAWEGIPDYKAKMSVKNLTYGMNLYLTLAEIGCKRVLTTGSCWEYGKQIGELTEDTPILPNNPFTTAKNALRLMGSEIAKENEMQFIWVRLYYVYGPRQKSASLIPYIIESVREHKVPQIKTPDARNDFIFVDDVARAIMMILQKSQKQSSIYNIGSGHSTSIRDIVSLTYELCNLPIPEGLNKASNKNVTMDFWADISRIKQEIGWQPEIDIRNGIKKMLEIKS